jgi:hypothetical protein
MGVSSRPLLLHQYLAGGKLLAYVDWRRPLAAIDAKNVGVKTQPA